MKKLSPAKLALALGLAFAVVHTSFDILSLIAPNYLQFVFNSWFHGFNLRLVVLEETFSYDLPKIIFGWITSVSIASVIGYLIGFFYNHFLGGD